MDIIVVTPDGPHVIAPTQGEGPVTVIERAPSPSTISLGARGPVGATGPVGPTGVGATGVAGPTGPVATVIPRYIQILVTDPTTLLTTDDRASFFIPADMDEYTLSAVQTDVLTVSSLGLPTVQIANLTQGYDMLSTAVTIDESEHNSKDATVPVVIAASHAVVTNGDELQVRVDVAGTGTQGLMINLTFLPA